MSERSARRLQWLLVAITILIGIGAQAILPSDALMPTHFTVMGEADAWSPASAVLMHIPEFLIVSLIARHLSSRIWPQRFRSTEAVERFAVGYTVALVGLQIYRALLAFGSIGPIWRAEAIFVAALAVFFGNFLGKTPPNDAIGFRWKWTLAHPDVWDRTHRFAGKSFVLAGLAILLFSMLSTPYRLHGMLIVGPVIVALLATGAKAYWLARAYVQTDRRTKYLRLATRLPLFAVFAYGAINFHDAPYKPCGGDNYCGKSGEHHSAADATAFEHWENIFLATFLVALVGGLVVPGRRSQ